MAGCWPPNPVKIVARGPDPVAGAKKNKIFAKVILSIF
jgi:hypothetical protein